MIFNIAIDDVICFKAHPGWRIAFLLPSLMLSFLGSASSLQAGDWRFLSICPEQIINCREGYYGRLAPLPNGEKITRILLGQITSYNLSDGTLVVPSARLSFGDQVTQFASIGFSSDSKLLAVGDGYGQYFGGVQFFYTDTGELRHRLALGQNGMVTEVAFQPGSHDVLIVHSEDGESTVASLLRYDFERDLKVISHKDNSGAIRSVAFLDPERIVTGQNDGSVRIWNFNNFEALKLFNGHTKVVGSIAPVFGMQKIVSGSEDGTIRIWDTENKEPPNVIQAHKSGIGLAGVSSLDVSSDGKVIVSCGLDEAVIRGWSVETGRKLFEKEVCANELYPYLGGVSSVALSPDTHSMACLCIDSSGLHFASPLVILSSKATTEGLRIEWFGGSPPYQVQGRTSLLGGAWQNLGPETPSSSLTLNPELFTLFRVIGTARE